MWEAGSGRPGERLTDVFRTGLSVKNLRCFCPWFQAFPDGFPIHHTSVDESGNCEKLEVSGGAGNLMPIRQANARSPAKRLDPSVAGVFNQGSVSRPGKPGPVAGCWLWRVGCGLEWGEATECENGTEAS